MHILAGPGGIEVARKVGLGLGVPVQEVMARTFPDGERLLWVPRVPEGSLALVQSTAAPQDARLMELFFILDVLREQGRSTTLIIPYFGYGRQDKAFKTGEVASAMAVLRILATYLIDHLVLVDPHFHRTPGIFSSQGLSCTSLSAAPLMVERISSTLKEPLVIGPDQGSANLVRKASGDAIALSKTRTGDRDVSIDNEKLAVEGRDVIVFDDMVSTGGTMIEAVRIMREQGARRIVAACTHGVFVEGADARILDAGADELVCSDTIPGPHATVSVAPLIAQALRE